MKDKYELVGYLASLITIMDSMDDAGGIRRSPTIGREYERGYAQLKEIIEKEEKDEARKSDQQRTGSGETHNGQPQREPRISGRNRDSGSAEERATTGEPRSERSKADR